MAEVNITPRERPYLVSGPVKLTDVDGREIEHPDRWPSVAAATPQTSLSATHPRHDRLRRHARETDRSPLSTTPASVARRIQPSALACLQHRGQRFP